MKDEVPCKILCHNICCMIKSQLELGIEAAGLRVSWTGSIRDKLDITGFRWQRRSNTAE